MTTPHTSAAMTANSINLIDKDNAGSIFLALHNQITNPTGANANKHFDEVRSGDRKEWYASFTGDGSAQQSFTSTWSTDQQNTFRDTATEAREFFRIFQKGDDFFKFIFGFVNTGHVVKGDLG